MPEEPVDPFLTQQPKMGGLAQLVPQDQQQFEMPEGGWLGGVAPTEGGSYYAIDPSVMAKMWAPQNPESIVQQPQQLPGMTQPLI